MNINLQAPKRAGQSASALARLKTRLLHGLPVAMAISFSCASTFNECLHITASRGIQTHSTHTVNICGTVSVSNQPPAATLHNFLLAEKMLY